jgi:hypothetical protein
MKLRIVARARLWPLALSLLAAASCAASGSFVGDPGLLHASEQRTASVTVMRMSQIAGAGSTLPVELDGFVIAHLGTGECVRVFVSVGEHFVLAGERPRGELQKFAATTGDAVYLRFEQYASSEHPWHFDRLAAKDGAKAFASGDYKMIGKD